MHYKSHSQSSKVQKHGWRIHGSSTHVLGRCSKTRKEVISQWIHWLIIFQIPRARPAKFCIYLKLENTTLSLSTEDLVENYEFSQSFVLISDTNKLLSFPFMFPRLVLNLPPAKTRLLRCMLKSIMLTSLSFATSAKRLWMKLWTWISTAETKFVSKLR